jgi:hypothetical protein
MLLIWEERWSYNSPKNSQLQRRFSLDTDCAVLVPLSQVSRSTDSDQAVNIFDNE